MAKLSQLFDLQKFVDNDELQNIIDDTHKRYSVMSELSDDDLELAAAGRMARHNRAKSCPNCGEDVTNKVGTCPNCKAKL